MPIYTFKCRSCGADYEELVPMGTENYKCSCGESATKVPSLSNFHLKGVGWASNGYSKEGKNKK